MRDLNVAHNEIDLKNPASNRQNAGFTDEEREKMTTLIQSAYRQFQISISRKTGAYTWWSYMFNARKILDNIDYFLVSTE